ncbi:hypothetical protein XENOCAPTIV_007691 [Xenoophorus captivus]|uniref:Uncharacterized protein n=1 Tax=Xenoophorus captivus TaxID=1517983 RepID=A0ABV0QQH3_9TELE
MAPVVTLALLATAVLLAQRAKCPVKLALTVRSLEHLSHFCPAGTVLPQPCPIGTFNNQTGAHSLSACLPCPSGVYCSSYGASTPQGGVSMQNCFACPAGHYCSSDGLAFPSGPCSAGFYCPFDFSSTTPYAFLCPKGQWCHSPALMGRTPIQTRVGYRKRKSVCHALQGSSAGFTPQGSVSNMTHCQWGVQCAGPCPPGDPVIHLCPAGHYCDGLPGSDFSVGTGPRPCPMFTYRASPGAGSKGDCLPCPPGSNCNSTGTM